MDTATLIPTLARTIAPAAPAPPGTTYRLLVPNAHYGGLLEYLRSRWPGEVAAVTASQQAFSYLAGQGCYAVLGSPREVHVPAGSASALLVEYEESLLQAAGRDKAILTRFLPALAARGPVVLHTSRPRLARLAGYLAAALTDLRAWGGPADDVYVLGRSGAAAAGDRPATAKALRAFALGREERVGPDTPVPAVPAPAAFRTRGGFMPAVLLAEAAEHGVFAERYRRELLFPPWQRRITTLMPPRRGHLALLVAGGSLDGAVITTPDGARLLLKGLVRKRQERIEEESGYTVDVEVFESEVNAVDLDTGRYLVMH